VFEEFFKTNYVTFKILSDVAITAISFVGLGVLITILIYQVKNHKYTKRMCRYLEKICELLEPYERRD
jgi:hypothetical protein